MPSLYLPFYKRDCLQSSHPFAFMTDIIRLVSQRINILKLISMNGKTYSEDCIFRDLESCKMAGSESQEPQVMNDKLAHMFTSFAYCHTKKEREWFVKQETRIFKARFRIILVSLDKEKRNKFILETLQNLKKIYPQKYCPWEMVRKLPDKMDEWARTFLDEEGYQIQDDIITLPFEFCPHLIRNTLAYFFFGTAYVPLPNAIHVIYSSFSLFLHDALLSHKKLFSHLPTLSGIGDEDNEEIFIQFLRTASQKEEISLSNIPISIKDCLRPSDVDHLASNFQYPLCMRELHQELTQEGKLKNTGRLQYTLFLKEIGLSYENCENFFREKFAKKGTSFVFNRDYVYGIRYNYGLEGGNREARREYSCKTILQLHTPQGPELHGCPFKTYSKKELSKQFKNMKIKEDIIGKFLSQLEEGRYQETCRQLTCLQNHDISKTEASKYIAIYPSAVVKAVQEQKNKN